MNNAGGAFRLIHMLSDIDITFNEILRIIDSSNEQDATLLAIKNVVLAAQNKQKEDMFIAGRLS